MSAIDAWLEENRTDNPLTNKRLAQLLSLLPPDEVPIFSFTFGPDNVRLTGSMISVGEKSDRLYFDIPAYGATK